MATIEFLLKWMKIKFTKTYLKELYDLNPYKDTFFGISDILSEYNIKTEGYRVRDKNDLDAASLPLIVNIDNQFAIISKVTDDSIIFCNEKQKTSIPIDKFFTHSNGTILTYKLENTSIEPNYSIHKKMETFSFLRKSALIVSAILLSVLGVLFGSSHSLLQTFALLPLYITGVYIGYLLLQKQMQIQNINADKICSFTKKGDCNAILNMPESKFMGIIGWSEIGLGYFIASLLILLFIPSLTPCLGIISCCALPYTIWSIWFQKFKAKQWCILCLIVQSLLWLLFFTYLVSGNINMPQLFIPKLLITGSVFTLSILSINISITYFINMKGLEIIIKKYNKLKINEDVFRAKLTSQDYYIISKKTSVILFGNKNAKNLITVFSNPHCEPCAMMHKRISHLLKKAGNKICVQYIFSSFSPELQPSSDFLTAAYLADDISRETKQQIYNEWFEHGKLKAKDFFDKYNISTSNSQIKFEAKKHHDWKMATQLLDTPTILFNGYRLPDEYIVEDMVYFTDIDLEKTK
ncbi:vitamin K epoxide reductase family protein [Dysgonomonas sp. ZJ709]|uniref:vitamin K epoxide reductase family protein n=1 Tax=Dysgonomonas sp. ZJ709 TaxID=2709797 RepID=UPI0013ECF9D4|nr:vitamin K epoxide reductase family protein [Dysgonomonas sp. ZJ709]